MNLDKALYKVNIKMDNTNSSHNHIISFTPVKSRVLDVGCACGDLGKVLFEIKDCKLWGFEYNEESIKIAKSLNVYENIFPVDLNNLNIEDFSIFQEFFDVLILGDILEHLYDPMLVISKLKFFSKADGIFIISFPNFSHGSIKTSILLNELNYSETGLLDKTHIRFFTFNNIIEFLTNANLLIEELKLVIFPINHELKFDPYKKLPLSVLKFIISDNHSFVYQYVIKAKITFLNKDRLIEINKDKFILNKENVPSELIKQKNKAFKKLFRKIFLPF